MATSAINQPFSAFGPAVRTKVLMLGEPDARGSEYRSLPIEHVSFGPDAQKISDHPPPSLAFGELRRANQGTTSAARRWFFGRKPDAGFLLSGFPATLLHAKIFDEWLETRHESLDAVLVGSGAPESVVAHYRTLGLIE
ncbi:MAG TPA: adenylate kinase [Opitutaceae bacterium]